MLGQNHFAEPNWHVLIITEIGNCCGGGDHDGFSIPYSAESKSGAKQQKVDPTKQSKMWTKHLGMLAKSQRSESSSSSSSSSNLTQLEENNTSN